jgi:hypothetical protein
MPLGAYHRQGDIPYPSYFMERLSLNFFFASWIILGAIAASFHPSPGLPIKGESIDIIFNASD